MMFQTQSRQKISSKRKNQGSRSTTCFYTIAKEKIHPKRQLSFSLRPLVFLGGVRDKEPTCQCRRCKRRGFYPWVGKIPWRRRWQPTPVFSSGESHGQRSLAGYGPQNCKDQDRTEATQHTQRQLVDFSIVNNSTYGKMEHWKRTTN